MIPFAFVISVVTTLAGAGGAPAPAPLEFVAEEPALGQPVFKDRFEGSHWKGSVTAYDGSPLWMVQNGTVDLIRKSHAPSFVDLGGTSGRPGEFQTRFPILFLPDVEYKLSFDYKSVDGAAHTACVQVGSQTFRFSTASASMTHFVKSLRFHDSTQLNVVFQDLGKGQQGVGIANVTLTPVSE